MHGLPKEVTAANKTSVLSSEYRRFMGDAEVKNVSFGHSYGLHDNSSYLMEGASGDNGEHEAVINSATGLTSDWL